MGFEDVIRLLLEYAIFVLIAFVFGSLMHYLLLRLGRRVTKLVSGRIDRFLLIGGWILILIGMALLLLRSLLTEDKNIFYILLNLGLCLVFVSILVREIRKSNKPAIPVEYDGLRVGSILITFLITFYTWSGIYNWRIGGSSSVSFLLMIIGGFLWLASYYFIRREERKEALSG